MAPTYDLKKVESLDLFVPAPPKDVQDFLASQVSVVPLKGHFTGSIANGRMSVLRKAVAKRNMRPYLEGRLEPVAGGTRVVATCALPRWARFMGRGVAIYAAALGLLWLGMGAAMSGVPDNPWILLGALFMALVWLPFTGVVISGGIVAQGVAEREATPQLMARLLQEQWPDTRPTSQAEATHAASPRGSTEREAPPAPSQPQRLTES